MKIYNRKEYEDRIESHLLKNSENVNDKRFKEDSPIKVDEGIWFENYKTVFLDNGEYKEVNLVNCTAIRLKNTTVERLIFEGEIGNRIHMEGCKINQIIINYHKPQNKIEEDMGWLSQLGDCEVDDLIIKGRRFKANEIQTKNKVHLNYCDLKSIQTIKSDIINLINCSFYSDIQFGYNDTSKNQINTRFCSFKGVLITNNNGHLNFENNKTGSYIIKKSSGTIIINNQKEIKINTTDLTINEFAGNVEIKNCDTNSLELKNIDGVIKITSGKTENLRLINIGQNTTSEVSLNTLEICSFHCFNLTLRIFNLKFLKLNSMANISSVIVTKSFVISNTNIKDSTFNNVDVSNSTIWFIGVFLNEAVYNNVKWPKNYMVNSMKGIDGELLSHKETYRQLKNAYLKQDNIIEANFFKVNELEVYKTYLTRFSTKIMEAIQD